jgi:hypothetical protein
MASVGVAQIVEPKVRNARLPACIELGLTGEAEPELKMAANFIKKEFSAFAENNKYVENIS